MTKKTDSQHWRFALFAAIYRIEQLVWDFDVEKDARNRAYAGVPTPNELITIIDGFLNEGDLLQQGTKTKLEETKEYINQNLVPIYKLAQTSALEYWTALTNKQQESFSIIDFADLRLLARHHSPHGLSTSQQNWFVEEFSKQCRTLWVEYLKNTVE